MGKALKPVAYWASATAGDLSANWKLQVCQQKRGRTPKSRATRGLRQGPPAWDQSGGERWTAKTKEEEGWLWWLVGSQCRSVCHKREKEKGECHTAMISLTQKWGWAMWPQTRRKRWWQRRRKEAARVMERGEGRGATKVWDFFSLFFPNYTNREFIFVNECFRFSWWIESYNRMDIVILLVL